MVTALGGAWFLVRGRRRLRCLSAGIQACVKVLKMCQALVLQRLLDEVIKAHTTASWVMRVL